MDKQSSDPDSPVTRRLDSWKEIAVYLKRSVRTVQRWEQREGLPVHRHQHQRQGSVYAYAGELDEWFQLRRSPRERSRSMPEAELRSVAVLPFVAVGPDLSFAEGLTDEVISRLGRLEGIRVPMRSAVLALQESASDLLESVRSLGVDALVEGSVRPQGDRLRANFRLLSTHSGESLTAGVVEVAARDDFRQQDQLAEQIIDRLLSCLQPRPDSAVSTLCGRGRFFWNRRNREGLNKALECYREALRKDPQSAAAQAGLADCWNMLAFHGYCSPAEGFSKARTAAQEALQLDPSTAPALASLGFISLFFDWQWEAAEQEFDRALQMDAGYAVGHYWRGLSLGPQGRPYEAIEAVRRAQSLEPMSPVINSYVAGGYLYARLYSQAVEKCRAILEMEADFGPAHLFLGRALLAEQGPDAAVDSLSEALRCLGSSADAVAMLGHCLARMGREDTVDQLLSDVAREEGYLASGHRALIELGFGRTDRALQLLNRSVSERFPLLVFLKVDPLFDPLRSHPEFSTLTDQIGLR